MTQASAAVATDTETELRSLRAEVDRLTNRLDRVRDEASGYEQERDDALHELRKLEREQAVPLRKAFRPDTKRIDAGDWVRASNLSVCEVCGYQYWEHADVPGFEWIHRLCDGRLVKL